MRLMGDGSIITYGTDFRLLDAEVIKSLRNMPENIKMFRRMVDWLGYPTCEVQFDAPSRYEGKANYKFSKLVELAVSALTTFSLTPLKLTGYLGAIIALISFFGIFLTAVMLNMFANVWYVSPLAIVVLVNTLLVGVLMIC